MEDSGGGDAYPLADLGVPAPKELDAEQRPVALSPVKRMAMRWLPLAKIRVTRTGSSRWSPAGTELGAA